MIRARQQVLVFLTSVSVCIFFSLAALAAGCGSRSTAGVASSGSGSGSNPGTPAGSGGSSGPSSGSGSGSGGSGGSGSGGSGGSGSGGSGGSGSGGSGGTPTGNAQVYVSLGAGSIQGYTASSSGSLTPISGSPFSAPGVDALASNGKFLFAAESSKNIVTFSIASSGAISQVSTINAQALNTYPTDGGPLSLFTDPKGLDVYDHDIYADGANSRYQAFAIGSAGALTYSGVTSYGDTQQFVLSFTADDSYAYGSDCYKGGAIYAFMRNANGSLTYFDPKANTPAPPSGQGWCTIGAAVSPDNHVVIALGETPDGFQIGNSQLAVYTIQSDGTLTTTDTTSTMPTDKVGTVNDYRFDPKGTTLAVAGQSGLEIYGFSGGKLTAEGGPLTSDPINKVEWDSAGHLYAIGKSAGKLYVFTVSGGAATQVSGSPYALSSPNDLAVAPVS